MSAARYARARADSASGITGALPASRSAKAEFHARQAQYDASLKRGDEEFVVLLEHLDDRKDRIESTRHTKIRVRQWLDKLCEPMSSLEWRRNRNAYARLLIKQLDEGELSEPFIKVPDAGPLSTLPTYLLVRAPKSPTFKVVSSPRGHRPRGASFGQNSTNAAWKNPHGRSRRESKYGEHETDMYEDIGTKGRGTNFGVTRSLETSRSWRRISSSASSASVSSSSAPQNEAAYWQRRAQEAEKTARFLEAQLERVEAELEAERALRSKEKHRLRQLHQAEVDELQRLHASEVEQMQRLGGGFRESIEEGGASHCALLREDGGLSQRSGGGANTSVGSRQDVDAYDSEPDAAADLNSSAFFEYLSGFEASAARLIAGEEDVLSAF